MADKCTIPPEGWACTRRPGHDGPCAAIPVGTGPTQWASPTLGNAYFEIDKLRSSLAQHPESGIDEALRRALTAIEAADCEIAAVSS